MNMFYIVRIFEPCEDMNHLEINVIFKNKYKEKVFFKGIYSSATFKFYPKIYIQGC